MRTLHQNSFSVLQAKTLMESHSSDKQRRALELALEFGYYNYPRNISVDNLSKKAKMPRTTFQEHLRKAESKLMGLLIQSIKK